MNKLYPILFLFLLQLNLSAQHIQRVTDINYAGGNGLGVRNLTVFNSKLYFFGTDEKVYVDKLMFTDGTNAGTQVVKTIDSAKLNPTLGHLTVLDNLLIFFNGTQVWKSDGSTAGTTVLATIKNKYNGFFHAPTTTIPLPVLNHILYFGGDIANSTTINEQLCVTDGTPGGTVLLKTINPTGSANISNFFVDGTKIYFSATNGVDKEQLWVTDGTAAGTRMVKKINPTATATVYNFVSYNNKVYFYADDGVNGGLMWVTDGTDTGTKIVSLIAKSPRGFVPFNGKLYFCAIDIGSFYQLWETDGTASGTKLVMTDYHTQNGYRGFQPFAMAAHKGKLYMSGFDSTHSYQLWESDGTTAGTLMVTHSTKSYGFNPVSLLSFQNRLVINYGDVWASDGTDAGTKIVDSTLNVSGYSPLYPFEGFVLFNNALYYTAAYRYFADYQLCRYSEAPAGIEDKNLKLVKVFPNPATNSISISSEKEFIKASIYNLNGRLLEELNPLENKISISHLSPGMYLLIAEDKTGIKFTNRFIKE